MPHKATIRVANVDEPDQSRSEDISPSISIRKYYQLCSQPNPIYTNLVLNLRKLLKTRRKWLVLHDKADLENLHFQISWIEHIPINFE